uniref:Uncharacterized protein n=1 Tax=Leersia perrieri TaxID=77586 RepID=A0A0D9WZL5_9ORYZ
QHFPEHGILSSSRSTLSQDQKPSGSPRAASSSSLPASSLPSPFLSACIVNLTAGLPVSRRSSAHFLRRLRPLHATGLRHRHRLCILEVWLGEIILPSRVTRKRGRRSPRQLSGSAAGQALSSPTPAQATACRATSPASLPFHPRGSARSNRPLVPRAARSSPPPFLWPSTAAVVDLLLEPSL